MNNRDLQHTVSENERIGTIGENRFKDLCDRARLLCSRPVPDRTGKDFVVEFPLEDYNSLISYDKRKAPKKLSVQVKTVASSDRPAVISLSVAERLARNSDPSIICLFVYDREKDDFIALYIIHILGDNLGRVLKRLRQASSSNVTTLHKSTINFTLKSGFSVNNDPSSLREAFNSIVSPDMETYILEKLRQIETIGYEINRFNLKFDARLVKEETIDAFLGLRELPIENARLLERRFSIELPAHGIEAFPDRGSIFIQPEPIAECQLIATVQNSNEELTVDAVVYGVPAGLIRPAPTYLFKWMMGRAKISAGGANCNLTLEWDFTKPITIDAWSRQLHFYHRLLTEKCKLKARSQTFTLNLAEVDWCDTNESQRIITTLRFLDACKAIFEELGLIDVEFLLDKLLSYRRTIAILESLRTSAVKLTAIIQSGMMPELSGSQGMFISAVEVIDHWIAVVFPVTFETRLVDQNIEWTCYRSDAVTLSLLDGDIEAAFESFKKTVEKLTRSKVIFFQYPNKFMSEEMAVQVF